MAIEAMEVKESGQGKKYTKKKNKSVHLREKQRDWSLQRLWWGAATEAEENQVDTLLQGSGEKKFQKGRQDHMTEMILENMIEVKELRHKDGIVYDSI